MFFLILVLFLLVGGALVVFTLQNLDQSAHIVIFQWQSPEVPVGLWLIGAFLLGAFLLYLVAVISAWGDRRELKALRKQIAALEQEKATAHVPQQISPAMPQRVPTAPLTNNLRSSTGPLTSTSTMPTVPNTKTTTGSLPSASSYIPMPGINPGNSSQR